MKALTDAIESIKGNMNARVNEPFIGALICSWVICNWDKLIIFFFGNKEIEDRVQFFSGELTRPFDSLSSFFVENKEVYFLPLVLALFYLFVLPWISICVSKLIAITEIIKHRNAVDLEIKQAEKQRKLNAEKLRGDPNQKFLSEYVENQLSLEKAITEKAQSEAAEAELKRKAEEARAEKTKAEANLLKLEAEKKLYQAEQDKIAFSLSAKINKSSMQANAYFASYQLVRMLDKSLRDDSIVLSLDGLTKIVATVFGYDSYDALLNDKNFTNESLKELKYVLCDSDFLSKEFELILDDEDIDHEKYESTWLIQHIEMVFEELPYDFVFEDTLADTVFDRIETENRYRIIEDDKFASAQAETDTIIDDIDLYEKSHDFRHGEFVIEISGRGAGNHRKDEDIPGRGVDFSLEAILPVKWGKFGLADYVLSVTHATPEDYGADISEDESVKSGDSL